MTTSAASYDSEKVDEVLRLMHHGITLTSACETTGLAKTSFLDWKAADVAGLGDRYARAREGLFDHWADEVVEISDDGRNDTYTDGHGRVHTDNDVINRSRLRVDTRKWLLSKLKPEQYGDSSKQTIDMTVKGQDPATVLAARRKAREGGE